LVFADPGGNELVVPGNTPPGSGWDIKDLRITYDPGTDILYVGVNSYNIVGDADGDGNEAAATYGGGVDNPGLGGTESVSVYFDLDQDGSWDVIAGVPSNNNISGFSVSVYGASPILFGAPLPTHTGTVYYSPSVAAPDFEFTILDFDGLPNQGGELGAFDVGAFMGSLEDGAIGEDDMVASASPAIDVEKLVSSDNVNFYDADTSGAALQVSAGGNIYFKYIVTNTGNVTLTSITLSDNIHDVSGITKTDPLAPLASFEGIIGPITALSGLRTNIATATGNWDGFVVEDTDPAYYRTPQEVGGTAWPVGKLGLVVPLAVVLACAGLVTLLMLRQRRRA
jgi:hypothetical protein